MTPQEREQAKKARKEREQERQEQERKDKDLILTAMRDILSDATATAEQKLYAFAVLCNMKYYSTFVPYGIPFPGKVENIDLSRLREKFADQLEALKAKETTKTQK